MLCFQAITQLSIEPRVLTATSFTGTKREDPGNELLFLALHKVDHLVTKIAAARSFPTDATKTGAKCEGAKPVAKTPHAPRPTEV